MNAVAAISSMFVVNNPAVIPANVPTTIGNKDFIIPP